jgi:hypothetical protein
MIGLALAGCLFVLAGVLLVFFGTGGGPSSVTTHASTNPTSTTTTTTPAASPGGTPTVNSTVTGGGTVTKVRAVPGRPARGSDTLETFLIGYGAILILCGVFYDRIKKVDLPGGGGFELTPASEEKLTDEIKKKSTRELEPHELERALRRAEGELLKQYWGKRAAPSDDALTDAATKALS